MKAIVCHRYGPPQTALRLEEVEKPVPGNGEVLLRVRAAAVNPLDWHLMKGKPAGTRLIFGLTRPRARRPGRDVAGVVEAVGGGVTRFRPGDEAFGGCLGAFAEFAVGAEAKLARKPAAVSFEDAAATPVAGLTALQGLRDSGKLQAGERVLVHGAGGGVGTFAIQIARAMGARVTGVCSARNVELVRSLGAERVFDYSREDFTRSGERFDLLLDCVCDRPLGALRRALERDGRLVAVGAPRSRFTVGWIAEMLTPILVAPFVSQKIGSVLARVRAADLEALGELLASGKVRPVVDRRQGLESVAQAIREISTGHARGKLVVVP